MFFCKISAIYVQQHRIEVFLVILWAKKVVKSAEYKSFLEIYLQLPVYKNYKVWTIIDLLFYQIYLRLLKISLPSMSCCFWHPFYFPLSLNAAVSTSIWMILWVCTILQLRNSIRHRWLPICLCMPRFLIFFSICLPSICSVAPWKGFGDLRSLWYFTW